MYRSISCLFVVSVSFAACVASFEDEPPATSDRDHAASQPTTSAANCAALGNEATARLAAAQRCHVAAANPFQCATWVPSIDGCQQPVAHPSSDEVKAYLAAFEVYAANCPLPDRPCVDPSTLAVDCTQSPDVDSAFGRCAILEP